MERGGGGSEGSSQGLTCECMWRGVHQLEKALALWAVGFFGSSTIVFKAKVKLQLSADETGDIIFKKTSRLYSVGV